MKNITVKIFKSEATDNVNSFKRNLAQHVRGGSRFGGLLRGLASGIEEDTEFAIQFVGWNGSADHIKAVIDCLKWIKSEGLATQMKGQQQTAPQQNTQDIVEVKTELDAVKVTNAELIVRVAELEKMLSEQRTIINALVLDGKNGKKKAAEIIQMSEGAQEVMAEVAA